MHHGGQRGIEVRLRQVHLLVTSAVAQRVLGQRIRDTCVPMRPVLELGAGLQLRHKETSPSEIQG